MPTICVHCAIEGFVKHKGKAIEPPFTYSEFGMFMEEPEEHVRRVHPLGIDPRDRAALEIQAMRIVEGLKG